METTTATTAPATSAPAATFTAEHAALLEALGAHRRFLIHTATGLDEQQANARSTVSELTIAKIIKHVADMEAIWIGFVLDGPDAFPSGWGSWEPEEGETLPVLLDRYAAVAAQTDALVAAGLDLDAAQPLPVAPWFPPNTSRSARRVLVHLIAETAQHAGHADIIRETIDGQKTMG